MATSVSGKLISIREVAQRLGLSKVSVYRWTECGKLPSLKLGGRRLVSEAAIDALVASAMGQVGAE
jgi:excisionase family DNA binding protein